MSMLLKFFDTWPL